VDEHGDEHEHEHGHGDVGERRAGTLWGLAAVVGLVALAGPAPAAAYCRLTTSDPSPGRECPQGGEPLEWRRQCISYSLVERSAPTPPFVQVRDAVDRAFATWMDVECDGRPVGLSLQQTDALSRCDEPEHTPGAGNVNSIIFVDDWAERGLSSEAFGVTLIWHDARSGEIVGADMQVNESMGELVECDGTCGRDQVDIRNVVTHEAGHFLGLGHSQSLTASMYGEAASGETRKRFLNDDDRRGLCAIYGELPAAECTVADHAPSGGLATACYSPPGGCGMSVVGARAGAGVAGGRGVGAVMGIGAVVLVLGAWRRRRRRRDGGR